MAESTLVDTLKEDGRELIEHLVRDGLPIAVAWWVKPIPEEEQHEGPEWLFFLASPLVDQLGPGGVYQKVYTALRSTRLGDLIFARISLGQIKVIGVSDPATADVLKMLKRYPGKPPSWPPIYVARCRLGTIEAREVQVYPPSLWEKANLSTWYPVRLKKPVEVSQPPSPQDNQIMQEIAASGNTNTAQVGWWVWELQHRGDRQAIPAGTLVSARPLALTNSPNPFLLIETPDGRRGVALQDDTEPVPPGSNGGK
jgi:hypothetical protein